MISLEEFDMLSRANEVVVFDRNKNEFLPIDLTDIDFKKYWVCGFECIGYHLVICEIKEIGLN